MAKFIDKFSSIATEYARYRPVYPDRIWALIASHVQSGTNCRPGCVAGVGDGGR